MKKIFKIHSKILSICLVCCFMIFAVLITFNATANMAFAETSTHKEGTSAIKNDNATPMGIYTHLSLSINGGNGKIWATVKNDFTLFPATVTVIVELYSSDTYQEYHTNMTLMGSNKINDLNIGKTLTIECSTDGVQKYWQARMRYKIDSGGWNSEATSSLLFSADGTCLDA